MAMIPRERHYSFINNNTKGILDSWTSPNHLLHKSLLAWSGATYTSCLAHYKNKWSSLVHAKHAWMAETEPHPLKAKPANCLCQEVFEPKHMLKPHIGF